MEILLVSKARGSLGRVRVGVGFYFTLSLILSALVAGTGHLAYQAGEQDTAELLLQTNVRLETDWQQEVQRQREEIHRVREQSQQTLQALAARIGRLQAHVARLDAFGARMVDKLELSEDGFEFDSIPGIGGGSSEQLDVEVEDFIQALNRLSRELEDREQKLRLLDSVYLKSRVSEQTTPSGRPVKKGWLSSSFGRRTDPITGKKDFHRGIDFAGRAGTEIHAVADGVVTWADKRYNYGNMVEIDHGNGYISRYSHNKENKVKVGDRVSKDQVIALMGSTGRSTGPHVHFEIVHNGKIINPKSFIR